MILCISGHLVLSTLIFFMGLNKINKQERFCNFMIALFFPVGGYVTVLLLYLSRNQNIREIEDEHNIQESLTLFTDTFNKEKDINIVPLEETLIINDSRIKRQQLIAALKKDASRYIDLLKIALRDEDTETSHYAASAIDDIKRNLNYKMQTFSVQYERDKSDIELLKNYSYVLEEYLKSGLLDEHNHKKSSATYIQVLETLLEKGVNQDVNYYKLINILFQTGELRKIKKYCKEYLEGYQSENAYLMNLKYYYNISDRKNFNKILDKLHNSSIRLSNKGLKIVRYWLDGV